MTGVIVQLSADRSCGTIMGEDGVSVRFDLKSVLAHDIISLEAGKPVHFEIAPHHRHRAISVCIRPRVRVAGREGVSHLHSVRYLGFEQAAGVRAYEFRRTSPCESPLTLVVTTEVALFARHRVALQAKALRSASLWSMPNWREPMPTPLGSPSGPWATKRCSRISTPGRIRSGTAAIGRGWALSEKAEQT